MKYGFTKPNDLRALKLMNAVAEAVLKELPDISCAYGISDEYRYDTHVGVESCECSYSSFIFERSTKLFDRRERCAVFLGRMLAIGNNNLLSSKILTTVVSTFTSYYTHLWARFFPEISLSPPMPSFDGRVVTYPSLQNVRDYMSWRQVDCKTRSIVRCKRELRCPLGHINNLYNTTFWALVQEGGMDTTFAEEKLKVNAAVT